LKISVFFKTQLKFSEPCSVSPNTNDKQPVHSTFHMLTVLAAPPKHPIYLAAARIARQTNYRRQRTRTTAIAFVTTTLVATAFITLVALIAFVTLVAFSFAAMDLVGFGGFQLS
jgi:hypothetical protein